MGNISYGFRLQDPRHEQGVGGFIIAIGSSQKLVAAFTSNPNNQVYPNSHAPLEPIGALLIVNSLTDVTNATIGI